MDTLYLGLVSCNEDQWEAPVETIITLFLLEYVDSNINVRYVISPPHSEVFTIAPRTNGQLCPETSVPDVVRGCVLPAVLTHDRQLCVVGLCSSLRHTIKVSAPDHQGLLGFRAGCLQAPAEVSSWTQFCELDVVRMLALVRRVKSSLECMLQSKYRYELDFPEALLRFEEHMKQPIRVHNIRKRHQDQCGPGSGDLSTEQMLSELQHTYVEGPDLSIADFIILVCLHIAFKSMYDLKKEDIVPVACKWYKMLVEDAKVESILSNLSIGFKTFSIKEAVFEFPYVPSVSLYKKDPCRYKPKRRVFTIQSELNVVLERLESISFNTKIPKIVESKESDADCSLLEGSLPEKRISRKSQQLQSILHVLESFILPGDKVVDFCSGGGHLGITVAQRFPDVHVALVENKEYSVSRARQKVNCLGLQNVTLYQCNLDYFQGEFDIGLCLHACGVATDLVLQRCIQRGCSFVASPCCYGAVHDTVQVSYPRSKTFKEMELVSRDYFMLAHASDQTHVEDNPKLQQGLHCMNVVDTDRLMEAEEAGYQVHLAKMNPPSCSPKNNILVGVHGSRRLAAEG